MEQITAVLERSVREGEITGAAVRVYGKQGMLRESCVGFADLEKTMPVTADTIYPLCSMTKPVIGICVMKLVEEGKLSLQDPISRFVPAFSHMPVLDQKTGTLVPLKREITIYDCLNHSSGIGTAPIRPAGASSVGNDSFMRKLYPGMPLEERVQLYAEGPADFQPGEGTGYGSVMPFEILAYIVGCVSGMEINDYIRQNLADPLGIRDLTFTLDEEQKKRFSPIIGKVDGHLVDETETALMWKLVDPQTSGYHSGAAGLLGSLEAYSVIAQLLLHGGEYGGVRILREETVRRMAGNGTDNGLRFEVEARWGLSLACFDHPERMDRGLTPGSFGWSGAFGTHFYVDPVRELCVIMMTCGTHLGGADSPLSWDVERAVYAAMNGR